MGLLVGVGDFGLADLVDAAELAEQNASDAEAAAMNAAISIQEGKDLGPWNATANSPALSADASGVTIGGFYNVTVAGSAGFAGYNFPAGQVFNVGDRIARLGSQWYRRPFGGVGDNSVTFAKLDTGLVSNLTDKVWLKNPNPAAYSAGALQVIGAIRNALLFTGSFDKQYLIQTLCNNDATQGYRLAIRDVDSGTISAINSAPANPSGVSLVAVPLTDGGILNLYIDYGALPAGIVVNSATTGLVLNRAIYRSLVPAIRAATFYKNGVGKIAPGLGANSRAAFTLSSNSFIFLEATFVDGPAFFSLAPGSYEFSGNYKAYIVDLSKPRPANGSAYTPVERDYSTLLDESKFVIIAGIWATQSADLITFAGPLTPYVERGLDAALALKANVTDISAANSLRPLAIGKTDWVGAADFASRFAACIKAGVSLLTDERVEGFSGVVAKLTITNAANFFRLFDAYSLIPDRTKDLFVEFDYKTVSGAWQLVGYSLPTRSGVAELPFVALSASATVRRVRIKYTAAQVAATAPVGNKQVFYLTSGTVGAELWFGNVKVWQGDEFAQNRQDDELIYANTKALNSQALTAELLTQTFRPKPALSERNLRICCAGSSVTFGDGFLQSSMVGQLINTLQREAAAFIDVDAIAVTGTATNTVLNATADRKLFGGRGRKLTGAGAEISFSIEGNELSIVQQIERSNVNAADVEVYVDGVLYDTFNNLNPAPLGSGSKSFTGDGATLKFDLGQAFTYNHAVTVGGSAKAGAMNTGGYGATIPSGQDYLIIRKYGINPATGATEVHHWIWFAVAPAAGLAVTVNFDFGEEISYERTTIGKTTAGVLESSYGDGSIAFDATNPVGMSSGLDFRETDSRAVRTYRFAERATRAVRLKIKGLTAGATGTPYFTLNFITGRMLYFMNAGIGGWSSVLFNSNTGLVGSKQLIGFNPDLLLYESTPNDDWGVKGHRLSTTLPGLTLSQLRGLRTLPARSISYQSGSDTYDVQKWVGKIAAIEPGRVQLLIDATHSLESTPQPGDVVMVGGYFSNNREYVSRIVSSYDAATRWISFERPIEPRDYVYANLQQMVGMEVRVRNLSVYLNETRKLAEQIRASIPDVKIGLVGNPLPNLSARELWGYNRKIDELSDVLDGYYIDLSQVYNWQYSQPRNSATLTVDAAALSADPLTGRMGANLTDLATGLNAFNFEVIVNGKNVYGSDAVVYTGYGYSVDQSKTGAALNMTSSGNTVNTGQVLSALKPRLEFLQNAPVSGNIIIRYSTAVWAADSCHIGNADAGAKLYQGAYNEAVRSLVSQVDTNRLRGKQIDPNTITLPQLAQLLQDAGLFRKY